MVKTKLIGYNIYRIIYITYYDSRLRTKKEGIATT